MVRILFVYPAQENFTIKPIGLSLLMALARIDGHQVGLFDTSFMDLGGKNYNQLLTDNGVFKPVDWGCDVSKKKVDLEEEFRKKLDDFKPDLVAISALSDELPVAKRIISVTKEKRSIRIVLGNNAAHDTDADYAMCSRVTLIQGEAVETFPEWLSRGKLSYGVIYPRDEYFKDLNRLPYLYWHHFDPRHFLKAYNGKVYRGGDHMIGWGCTNSCAYCINKFWRDEHGGSKGCIRMYNIDRILDELCYLTNEHGIEFWKFHDEDFLLKPLKYLEELAEKYAERLYLPFTCMVNAKSVTERKVELLKKMNCVSVSMGVETGDPVMRSMLNRREKPEDIIKACILLRAHGIRVSTFNMIGLPFETEDTIKATILLNRKARVEHPNVSIYVPLKGTWLHDLAITYGMYDGGKLVTSRPTLKLPGITEEKLMWYFKNFKRLVTDG